MLWTSLESCPAVPPAPAAALRQFRQPPPPPRRYRVGRRRAVRRRPPLSLRARSEGGVTRDALLLVRSGPVADPESGARTGAKSSARNAAQVIRLPGKVLGFVGPPARDGWFCPSHPPRRLDERVGSLWARATARCAWSAAIASSAALDGHGREHQVRLRLVGKPGDQVVKDLPGLRGAAFRPQLPRSSEIPGSRHLPDLLVLVPDNATTDATGEGRYPGPRSAAPPMAEGLLVARSEEAPAVA